MSSDPLDKHKSIARNAVLLSSPANYAFGAGRHLIIHAEALAGCGMLAAAYATATMCYENAGRWQSVDLAWRSALLAARTAARGELAIQRPWLNRALEAVESLRSQILPEPLRIALATGRDRVYEELVATDYRAGDGVAALGHMEGAKSRVLVELLAGTSLPPPPAPEHLLDDERRLLGTVRELESHRVAQVLGLEPPDSGERLTEVRAELAAVRAELEQVWRTLEASSPRAAEYVTLRRGGPPKLADLATLLRS